MSDPNKPDVSDAAARMRARLAEKKAKAMQAAAGGASSAPVSSSAPVAAAAVATAPVAAPALGSPPLSKEDRLRRELCNVFDTKAQLDDEYNKAKKALEARITDELNLQKFKGLLGKSEKELMGQVATLVAPKYTEETRQFVNAHAKKREEIAKRTNALLPHLKEVAGDSGVRAFYEQTQRAWAERRRALLLKKQQQQQQQRGQKRPAPGNTNAPASAAANAATTATAGSATASTASTEGGAKKKQKVSGGGNLTAAKSGGASKGKKSDAQGKGKDKDKGKGKDDRQSIKQMNDVTAVAGVNIDDEQLMEFENDQGALDDDPAEAEAMFIEPAAVRRRIMRTAVRYGVSEVSDATTKFVSMMAEERIRSCITQLIAISKHRSNLARESNLPVEVSSDSRKLLRLIAKLEKEVIERKEKEHRDHLIAMAKKKESTLRREKAGEDGKFSELKQVRQEEIKRQQQNVTNAALLAAVGSKSMFQFKAAKAPAAAAAATPGTPATAVTPVPASVAMSAVSQPGGEDSHLGSTIVTRFKTREEQRKIALDDCIMFLEKEPQMCKSALLYKCYLRRGQELEPGAVPQDQRPADKGRRR